MINFKECIEGYGDKEYDFECYGNTEPIRKGDNFIFFFAGIADVQTCGSVEEEKEINVNEREHDHTKIDLVTGFWKNCYKIKSMNLELSQI